MADVRPLDPELKKIAEEELNEVESRIPLDLAALRDWIAKQPHIRARTDDQFLLAFLRGSKHSLEKAKSKIEHFYTIRTLLPQVFGNNLFDEKNLMICRSGGFVKLPNKLGGTSGPIVCFSRYHIFDQLPLLMKDLFRYVVFLMDLATMYDDNLVVSGYIEIIDLSKIGFSSLSKFDPIVAKQLSVYSTKATAVRVKGIHIINAPKEAHAVLSLVRTLMPDYMKDRFYSHKNMEELFEHIPKEYLPIEYGGQNGSLATLPKQEEDYLRSMHEYFEENTKYGVDESLRMGGRVDANELFGIEGTFRKLDID